jgi:hypothetical protein
MLDALTKNIIDLYFADPRNKIYVGEEVLLCSVLEELGIEINSETLRRIMNQYEDGTISERDLSIYDAAIYSCAFVAKKCFAEDPDDEDEEVDYTISFARSADKSISAVIRKA